MKRQRAANNLGCAIGITCAGPRSQCIAIGLLIVLIACNVTHEPRLSGTQLAEANQLYEAGEYTTAVSRYQALVDAGVDDGNLYYNLGVAYYRAGDLGRAVLNFRRAQHLTPRDGDVAANLRVARAETVDHIEAADGAVATSFVQRIIDRVTLNEASLIALALWILLCTSVIGAILWDKWRRALLYVSSAAGILLLLASALIIIGLVESQQRPPAVVVAQEVEMRSGPDDRYLIEFTLHAGAEVRVVERRGDWVRAALPGDLQGWAPNEAIIELFP